MRLITSTAPRAAYHDRNADIGIINSFRQASEADGETQRAVYTVPSGRQAFIGYMAGRVRRETVATTTTDTDEIRATWRLTLSGGGATDGFQVAIGSEGGSQGDESHDAISPGLVLDAGDAISVTDQFQGTAAGAGRARIVVSAGRVEFDA